MNPYLGDSLTSELAAYIGLGLIFVSVLVLAWCWIRDHFGSNSSRRRNFP